MSDRLTDDALRRILSSPSNAEAGWLVSLITEVREHRAALARAREAVHKCVDYDDLDVFAAHVERALDGDQ